MSAALEKDSFGCKVDGVIASGGLLSVGAQFLPPAPVVKILVFLARYYPRLVMPATDFESTFDDAFGDKDWAKTARQDPKISTQLKPTIGAVAATLSAGELIRAKVNEFPVKFMLSTEKETSVLLVRRCKSLSTSLGLKRHPWTLSTPPVTSCYKTNQKSPTKS